MNSCDKCGKESKKLHPIEDIQTECIHYFCTTCARLIIDLTNEDLIEEERSLTKNTDFQINLLKGNIAQKIIESIFQEFGYEVYPYGYESYLTNIIKHMKNKYANIPVSKIRATPDLFVYDRAKNEGYLVEVKATTTPDETKYLISKYTVDKYLKYWGEAILIVYCIPSTNVYCSPLSYINFEDLNIEKSRNSDKENYVVNLKDNFYTLSKVFSLIDENEYENYIKKIKDTLDQF